jgi:hypothetical protein
MLSVQHLASWQREEQHPMSSLDFDLDGQINNLELEWRLVYDASIVARAESFRGKKAEIDWARVSHPAVAAGGFATREGGASMAGSRSFAIL